MQLLSIRVRTFFGGFLDLDFLVSDCVDLFSEYSAGCFLMPDVDSADCFLMPDVDSADCFLMADA
jgi:hypothetical protein